MLLQDLKAKGLIDPPTFVPANTHYLVIMGSQAYGVATDDSDWDIYGWCIPPKEIVFPHLAGHIHGFGKGPQGFDQWSQHHVKDEEKGREYDLTVYNVVRFFSLLMEGNPNYIDSLFVPRRCVIHSTTSGELVRENRRLFLHKGCWHKFKGYSYNQMHKAKSQTRTGKRAQVVEEYGYDIKFASHCVRLLNEVEQILMEGDLDLERNNDQIKSVKRGEWTLQQVEEYFARKEKELESLYLTSDLPKYPDEEAIKGLLLKVLEEHYGDLGKAVAKGGAERLALLQIAEIVRNFKED